MGRSEHYNIDGRGTPIHRYEIEGEPLVVTQTEKKSSYRGTEHTRQCIRWVGLHRFQWGSIDKIVEQSLVVDDGPLGISATSSDPTHYTREEREAGREEVCKAMERIFGCRCFWTNEGGDNHVGQAEEKAPMAG